MIRIEGAKRWKERYDDDLLLMETYVLKNENRRGAVYLADNWTHVGQTSGTSISKSPIGLWAKRGVNDARGILARTDPKAAIAKYAKDGKQYRVSESEPKMIFVKPLVKDWKERIQYEKE
jgi:hypothetical protein